MNGKIECAFAGVVGTKPELKTSPAGKAWCAFNVRIGEGEAAQWARVAAFGEMADIATSLDKGANVYVEGSLALRTWRTESGEQRSGLNVAATRVEALGQIGQRRPRSSRPPGHGDSGRAASIKSDYQRPLDREPRVSRGMDEAIPF